MESKDYLKLADEAAAALNAKERGGVTPGPWWATSTFERRVFSQALPKDEDMILDATYLGWDDLAFIAWSRTGVERLAQAVRELVGDSKDWHALMSKVIDERDLKDTELGKLDADIICLRYERDEAREQALFWGQADKLSTERALNAEKERDEARAEVQRLGHSLGAATTEHLLEMKAARGVAERLKTENEGATSEVARLRKVLKVYASDESWFIDGVCDASGYRFEGQSLAQEALAAAKPSPLPDGGGEPGPACYDEAACAGGAEEEEDSSN